MSDWRERMKKLFERTGVRGRQPGVGMEEARRRIDAFIDGTVIPVFEDLAKELEQHGRQAVIERQPHMAVLTVYRGGHEEFSYAVRGRAYHKLSFAFPEHGHEEDPRIVRAEVIQSSGHGPSHSLEDFTREALYRDFLDEYAKWMGW